jgi:hypothetical protein
MAETQIRKTQIEGSPFDAETGHTHSGSPGDGPKIPMSGLSDVIVTSPEDGDQLIYDEASGKWVAQGSSGGGLESRTTDQIVTVSLAVGDTDLNQKFSLGKLCSVIRLQTSRPAWVRVYSKPAYQTADISRSQSVDPIGEHGVLLECITTSSNLILDC